MQTLCAGRGEGTGDTTVYRTAEVLPSPGWQWGPGLPRLLQVPFRDSGTMHRPVLAESTASSPAARVVMPAFDTVEVLALVEEGDGLFFQIL